LSVITNVVFNPTGKVNKLTKFRDYINKKYR